ncbi:putative leader peptide [Micromonospora harpali]|uniref:Leader peptide n=1 Tax=Micromonospora harpali TaxID=1490225 RepID=A0ABW1I2I6_9ACTN
MAERRGNVVGMNSTTELLTKRRAVDFCRVTTALCRAS